MAVGTVAPTQELFGWPFYAAGRYLVAAGIGQDGLVSMTGIDRLTGHVVWQVPTGVTSGALIDDATDGSHAFVATGEALLAFSLGRVRVTCCSPVHRIGGVRSRT